MSNEILEELNSSFISPEKTFKGQILAPYTEGSRLLMLQIKESEDSSIWFVWSFLYLHILLAKNKKETISLAWNKLKFKEQLIDWLSDKTEYDREIATELVSEIIQQAAKGRVEVIPSGDSKLGNA